MAVPFVSYDVRGGGITRLDDAGHAVLVSPATSGAPPVRLHNLGLAGHTRETFVEAADPPADSGG